MLDAGLKPILCIGESKEEYEAGLNKEVCLRRGQGNWRGLIVVVGGAEVWREGVEGVGGEAAIVARAKG